jgi:hypothetical protein
LPPKQALQTVDLRCAAVDDGLIPRRLPTVRIGWFPESFGLVVAVNSLWLDIGGL